MKQLRYTLEEFVEKNKEIDFFKDDQDATNFYNLMVINNYQPALLILYSTIKDRIGLVEFNQLIDSNLFWYFTINNQNYKLLEELLDYRLDDFVVNTRSYLAEELKEDLGGNYLLDDFIKNNWVHFLTLHGPSYEIRGYKEINYRLMQYLLRHKKKFIRKCFRVIQSNYDNHSLDYIGFLVILNVFFFVMLQNSEDMIIDNHIQRLNTLITEQLENRRMKLEFLLRHLYLLNYEEPERIDEVLFSRLYFTTRLTDPIEYQLVIRKYKEKCKKKFAFFDLIDIYK